MNEVRRENMDMTEKLPGKVGSFDGKKVLTPIQSIRAKCRDCSCGSTAEIRLCELADCALWPYRMGCRPKEDA